MKFIYSILLMIFIPIFANAEIIPETIYAVTPTSISHKNIHTNQTIELYEINDKTDIQQENCMNMKAFNVKIKEYIPAKRGKRNGYFKIEYEHNNLYMTGTMRESTPKDFESIAKQAGVTITGHILKVPGFSQVVAVSKGLIKPNENQNRIQSAGHNLYESTPLTYTEKGKDFDVEEDGIVVLKLKSENNDKIKE